VKSTTPKERVLLDSSVMKPGWYVVDDVPIKTNHESITVEDFKVQTGCNSVTTCDVKARGLE
jgi:hypothetical protein